MRAIKFAAPSIILALALTAGAQTTKPAATQPTTATKPATTQSATTRPAATSRATSRPTTTQATSQPTSRVTIDQTSPKGLLEGWHNAAMADDFDSMAQAVEPKFQPVMKSMMGALKKINTQQNSLKKAMVEKFGEEQATKLLDAGGPMSMGNTGKMTPLRGAMTPEGKILWDQIAIEEKGDKAEVTIADGPVLSLLKIDGKWYASMGSQDVTPEELEQRNAMTERMSGMVAKLMGNMEAGVRSGEITPENFQEKSMQAMQAAFQSEDEAGVPTTGPTSKPSASEDF